MKRTRAVDWDGTLVDAKTQEWLDGAVTSLRALLAEGPVIIHTCRANWPEGRAQIERKLAETFTLQWDTLGLSIEPKPRADDYIDNQSTRFTSWPQTMRDLAAC